MIQFKKVIVHNFGSYGHVELELQNRGFCLVSGQNNYTKDNALSNGSGKSFLWSAICFALTGETINGIKTNLKNIHIEEPECYVQLDFLYNKDLYSLLRTLTPRSDLKIFKNDIDLSGKGIRESERKLVELLPELSKDLIASTIIIGQGMPNKFSSFSPSGRKDLLERLTKSDFMIEDLKTRISARQQELGEKIREFEDSLLANRTQLNNHITNLERLKNTLKNQHRPEFDTLIATQEMKLAQAEQQKACLDVLITSTEAKLESLNQKLLELTNEKAKVSNEEIAAYTASHAALTTNKARLEFDIKTQQKEIKKLQSIVDTCPTCGQHIPNVHKPDTRYQELELQKLITALADLERDITQCETKHNEYRIQIDNAFKDEFNSLTQVLTEEKTTLHNNKAAYNICISTLDVERNNYNKLRLTALKPR